jgi:CheY-like chemotaxis protein
MAHVLVVDDDDDLRAVVRLALEDAGHRVTEAADGCRALADLRAAPQPLVVLLDLQLPCLGGAGVLAAVADDRARTPSHRYVVWTASSRTLPPVLDPVVARLGVARLDKPFDLEVLLELVAVLAGEAPAPAPDASAERAESAVGGGSGAGRGPSTDATCSAAARTTPE